MSFLQVSFYCFSLILIAAAIRVVTVGNPVKAALYLVLVFFSAACIWITLEAEFLAIVLVLVYVGAVMVLFLFVVMMLNVAQQKQSWFIGKKSSHIPFGLVVSVIIFLELLIVIGGWKYKPDLLNSSTIIISENTTNTHSLGNVLYTDYIHLFQLSGMILLVAMIGAIVLTFRQRSGLKRQSYFKQISRERSESIEIKDVETNKGVKIDD